MHADWLVPQWPAPAGVRALCSTRAGGVSAPPYASLNLGDHVGDDAAHVAANRSRWRRVLGARPVFLSQVHGTDVVELDLDSADGLVADAAWTRQPGLACGVMVADCLPVLLCTRSGLVAAAHAGWRGLAGRQGVGILEQTCAALRRADEAAAAPSDLMAWLGPCIGPDAFEVGAEVRQVFVAHDPSAQAFFKPHPPDKWLADLAGLARARLMALGVHAVYGNDGSAEWCTVRNPSHFFSFRRDRVCGRIVASIWREA